MQHDGVGRGGQARRGHKQQGCHRNAHCAEPHAPVGTDAKAAPRQPQHQQREDGAHARKRKGVPLDKFGKHAREAP